MKAEAQRIAIAEACGWTHPVPPTQTGLMHPTEGGKTLQKIPDYLNDLNAMRSAEKMIRGFRQAQEYCDWIGKIIVRDRPDGNLNLDFLTDWTFHASAEIKAEAFLRTIGKWTDETISGVSTPTTEGVTK